jgi:hypothetical protein
VTSSLEAFDELLGNAPKGPIHVGTSRSALEADKVRRASNTSVDITDTTPTSAGGRKRTSTVSDQGGGGDEDDTWSTASHEERPVLVRPSTSSMGVEHPSLHPPSHKRRGAVDLTESLSKSSEVDLDEEVDSILRATESLLSDSPPATTAGRFSQSFRGRDVAVSSGSTRGRFVVGRPANSPSAGGIDAQVTPPLTSRKLNLSSQPSDEMFDGSDDEEGGIRAEEWDTVASPPSADASPDHHPSTGRKDSLDDTDDLFTDDDLHRTAEHSGEAQASSLLGRPGPRVAAIQGLDEPPPAAPADEEASDDESVSLATAGYTPSVLGGGGSRSTERPALRGPPSKPKAGGLGSVLGGILGIAEKSSKSGAGEETPPEDPKATKKRVHFDEPAPVAPVAPAPPASTPSSSAVQLPSSSVPVANPVPGVSYQPAMGPHPLASNNFQIVTVPAGGSGIDPESVQALVRTAASRARATAEAELRAASERREAELEDLRRAHEAELDALRRRLEASGREDRATAKSTLEASLRSAEARVEALEGELRAARAEGAYSSSQARALGREEGVSEARAERERALEAARKDHEEAMERLRRAHVVEVEAMQKREAEGAMLSRLQSKLQDTIGDVRRLASLVEGEAGAVQASRTTAADARERAAEASEAAALAARRALENQTDTMRRTADRLVASIGSSEEGLRAERERLAEETLAVRSWRERVAVDIEKLRGTLQDELEAARVARHAAEGDRSAARLELDSARRDVTVERRKVDDARAELARIKSESTRMHEEAQGMLADAKKRLRDAQTAEARVEEARTVLDSDRAALEQRLMTLKRAVEEFSAEREAHSRELAERESASSQRLEEAQKLRDEAMRERQAAASIRDELDELRQQTREDVRAARRERAEAAEVIARAAAVSSGRQEHSLALVPVAPPPLPPPRGTNWAQGWEDDLATDLAAWQAETSATRRVLGSSQALVVPEEAKEEETAPSPPRRSPPLAPLVFPSGESGGGPPSENTSMLMRNLSRARVATEQAAKHHVPQPPRPRLANPEGDDHDEARGLGFRSVSPEGTDDDEEDGSRGTHPFGTMRWPEGNEITEGASVDTTGSVGHLLMRAAGLEGGQR